MAAAHANPLAGAAALTKAVGPVVFGHILANLKEVNGPVYTYRVELGYLAQHQAQLTNLLDGVGKSPKQWQNWFWVCLGGMILFNPTIWLNRGRWNPAKARQDEKQHQADVQAEYGQLVGAQA